MATPRQTNTNTNTINTMICVTSFLIPLREKKFAESLALAIACLLPTSTLAANSWFSLLILEKAPSTSLIAWIPERLTCISIF